jgi:hypothetical protein
MKHPTPKTYKNQPATESFTGYKDIIVEIFHIKPHKS